MNIAQIAQVDALRAEIERLKAERDSAVGVLSDFLEERGESWLVALTHPEATVAKISVTHDRIEGATVEITLRMPNGLALSLFRRKG